ncbi:17-beta-hydroxysteroid dehydrogenase 14-like [Sycon ciliatum]|uniref:17-beta-hydroxysteroid dehydrogenase 14-like n=1 Tax=Sycon ciliatum TaxID=27933 RepID=UPI0020AAF5C1|eukprot:scpid95424/ scgid20227/ 17-beta-hydroxysteroid dehydrogenase 14; 17-beta-hydroxysteroid dehydrogenase DHRS10; Dehydrogenase/reductase SDR family member 10; Retinal short-chain dehydrogenase/reductase retSDR3
MATRPLRFADRVVIVTGGSKGIGEGVVRVFMREGGRVVFTARGAEAGNKLQDELNTTFPQGKALFVKCDMTNQVDVQAMVERTVETFGRLDCLINNAGWHPPPTKIDDISVEDFRSLLDFNLVSYFFTMKFALPHLRKVKGSIINMSSLTAVIGQSDAVSYVATKGAITSMTKALAVEEARHGVRVNVVSPGNIWTPLWDSFASAGTDEQRTANIKAGEEAQLLGRMGSLEESGELCLYLAAEATFTTGVDHLLSGGAELNYGKKTMLPAE